MGSANDRLRGKVNKTAVIKGCRIENTLFFTIKKLGRDGSWLSIRIIDKQGDVCQRGQKSRLLSRYKSLITVMDREMY